MQSERQPKIVFYNLPSGHQELLKNQIRFVYSSLSQMLGRPIPHPEFIPDHNSVSPDDTNVVVLANVNHFEAAQRDFPLETTVIGYWLEANTVHGVIEILREHVLQKSFQPSQEHQKETKQIAQKSMQRSAVRRLIDALRGK